MVLLHMTCCTRWILNFHAADHLVSQSQFPSNKSFKRSKNWFWSVQFPACLANDFLPFCSRETKSRQLHYKKWKATKNVLLVKLTIILKCRTSNKVVQVKCMHTVQHLNFIPFHSLSTTWALSGEKKKYSIYLKWSISLITGSGSEVSCWS